ncbi:MAG: DNA replication/repair protein RecF [Calditrichaeota bacterium]|nr:MAG: DNA replication/repair protein RecF [Calditrichota bacterium]
MILNRLSLNNFRNYTAVTVQFESGINHIIGNNGQGKTNLLESIYCLGLAKSFRSNSDSELIRKSTTEYQVLGEFLSDNNVKHKIGIVATRNKKNIHIDRKKVQKYSELIGKIPVVLYNPDDHKITAGSPAERRRWLDIMLSQSDHQYLKDLQVYKRILKQRNVLLDSISRKEAKKEELFYWNSQFADIAERIIKRRLEILEYIRHEISEYYQLISSSDSHVHINYASTTGLDTLSKHDIEKYINNAIDKEIAQKTSLYGPHRDDILFLLNEKEVRRYASRGEHKSILLALKITEFNFLSQSTGSRPILLLDDIYSELDANRQKQLLTHLCQLGQTFITTTYQPKIPFSERDRAFFINDGNIEMRNFT